MKDCVVAVGSRNPVKIQATKRVFKLLCTPHLRTVQSETGVPSQPLGFKEVALGAYNRACHALKSTNADYGVGIEAGLIETSLGHIELQVAMIIDKSGTVGIGLSPGFQLPKEWVEHILERVELEEIAVKATGREKIGEKLGLIGYLTSGLITRVDLTFQALLMALIPFINRAMYGNHLSAEYIAERLGSRCRVQ
jgi:inosine/xanthosine triphosphatase